jgi:hypothetical protein
MLLNYRGFESEVAETTLADFLRGDVLLLEHVVRSALFAIVSLTWVVGMREMRPMVLYMVDVYLSDYFRVLVDGALMLNQRW